MNTIDALLTSSMSSTQSLMAVDPNPLVEVRSLQECQLTDVRVRALTGVVALMFDLRQSLQ
jgi:hypothetical protein